MNFGKKIRRQVRKTKTIVEDTDWKNGKIPPRHAPIFCKTKPLATHWKWRSLKLRAHKRKQIDFILLIEASPDYGKWKAMLLHQGVGEDWSCIARLEDQPGKKGLHAHANCVSDPCVGPESLNHVGRWPKHGARHRRQQAWTEASFFDMACATYRITEPPAQQPSLNLDA